MTTDELVQAACPLIRDLGWKFYFAPTTVERGQELGLDVFHFYFLGRGGVLGDVESQVVASAFGYFNPAVVADMWDSGRAVIAPREGGRAYMACCAQFGRDHLSQLPDLDGLCGALEAVQKAADPTALALYAAVSAEPLVDDLPGRAMQLVAMLRELRGSAHLLALVAVGLEPKTAHFLNRPDDMGLFGWPAGDVPVVTDSDRERLDAAEAMTDRIVRPAYSVLDDAGADVLLGGLRAMMSVLGEASLPAV